MENRKTVSKYFKYFSSQNSDSLENLFSEDIILCDWNISVSGRSKVKEAVNTIFNSVKTIKATPQYYFVNSEFHFAILVDLLIDNNIKISVIDVIKFNSEGKIAKITAFKLGDLS